MAKFLVKKKTCKDFWADLYVTYLESKVTVLSSPWVGSWDVALPGGSFCLALLADLSASPRWLSCIHGKHQFCKFQSKDLSGLLTQCTSLLLAMFVSVSQVRGV